GWCWRGGWSCAGFRRERERSAGGGLWGGRRSQGEYLGQGEGQDHRPTFHDSSGGPGGTALSSGGNAGCASDGGAHFSTRTRRSNQAAWPVTGSELLHLWPSPRGGRSSEIRWLRRKPLVASGASGDRAQAPLRLPMAFQVQTVLALSAAIWATGTVISP